MQDECNNQKCTFNCFSAPQSDVTDGEGSADDDNKRFLFGTLPTLATTAAPVRPFTQTLDLLLVVNSMSMTARK